MPSLDKPLNNLSKGELNSITDPKVKEIIFDKFYEMGFDPTNPSSTQMNKVFAEPIYFPETDRIIRKVRLDVASKTFKKVDKFERYLAYDSNYCLIIYKDLQDDKVKSEHYYLANVLNIDNIIDVFNRNNMNTEIITSVKSKDYFIKNDIPKEFDIEDKSTYNLVADRTYKVNTWTESSRQVELNLHNASIVKLGKTTFYPTSFNHTKVAINPIGELRYTK